MNNVGKIAVIGDKNSIFAFRAVGAETFDATDQYQAIELLRTLSKGDYAVIFITEDIAEKISDTLDKLKSRPYPAVIPIPSATGSNGYAIRSIKKDVEKAIGADILFDD